MIGTLSGWAAARGYRVAAAPATLLAEVAAEVADRFRRGELDAGFAAQWLKSVRDAGLPADLASRAVIVMAKPSAVKTFAFELPDRIFKAKVPPTYGEDSSGDRLLVSELQALMPGLGGLAPVRGPRKALAARLGLTAYGRNNITYVPGLGSYAVLCAVLTGPLEDVPAVEAPAPAVLAACASCTACREACPTGAIGRERFFIRAERCVTACNELPGPWPQWIPAAAHNSLIGCMACQEVCPYNKGRLEEQDSGVVFDRQETEAMLRGGAVDYDTPPWPAITEKLARFDLQGIRNVIGRNLAALL